MSQDSSLSLLRYVTCASWAQSHLTCRWPWPPHGLTVRSKRGTCEWETGRGEGGTWPPRGQRCDRSRISQSLVHFSPVPTAYTRASGTGSLRSALCALTPRSAHSNATASGASSASGLQEHPGRPGFPATSPSGAVPAAGGRTCRGRGRLHQTARRGWNRLSHGGASDTVSHPAPFCHL